MPPRDFLKGPMVACFNVANSPRLKTAIQNIVKKYPDVTLACFNAECYKAIREAEQSNVLFTPYGEKRTIANYNVIGAIVGGDIDVSQYGLKEIRI